MEPRRRLEPLDNRRRLMRFDYRRSRRPAFLRIRAHRGQSKALGAPLGTLALISAVLLLGWTWQGWHASSAAQRSPGRQNEYSPRRIELTGVRRLVAATHPRTGQKRLRTRTRRLYPLPSATRLLAAPARVPLREPRDERASKPAPRTPSRNVETVLALAVGDRPQAIINGTAGTRIVTVGDRIAGRRVIAIGLDGVRLEDGSLRHLAFKVR